MTSLHRFGVTALLIALATSLGWVLKGHFSEADVVMLYLLSVVVAATRFGRGPALLASALSVLAFDFFFVTPHFTFAVADSRHLVTFATLFIVGLSIGALADAHRKATLKAHTEEVRSSLLSSVSHDLRTPLAAITGAATTLRDRSSDLLPAQRGELIGAICDEAERLERLVSNLLDMSRLQSDSLSVKREWVPVEEVVGAALTQLEKQLGTRPVHVELPRTLPLVAVDPLLLEQALCNLLDNADKHTPPGAQVTLSAHALPKAVELHVDDAGPGLEPGTEQKVFEKFYRGKTAGGRGAGLGLAICRGVAEAHGGTLTASRAPLGGARFTLTLPIVGEPPAMPREQLEVRA